MKLCISLIVFVPLALASSASAGEVDLKPGLWMVQSKMSAAGGQLGAAQAQMQEQLAAMPPEQREMMQAMMAAQGVKLSGAGLLEVNRQICMTQEMIDRHALPVQEGNCKTTLKSRSGKQMKMSFECTEPAASGEGHYEILSPEAYKMKMTVRTSVEGKPETMTMDATGRWRGPDCGDVKPETGAAPHG